ncbi:MAG: hypothetical protein SNJ54_15715 [Anaerolineae bacterium]
MRTTESRAMTLTDVPMLRRYQGRGVILDAEFHMTHDPAAGPTSYLSSLLFNRGIYSYLARTNGDEVIGQFRFKGDDVNAHLLYAGPDYEDVSEDAWLALMDVLAREAGKLGAHALTAAIDVDSPLFEIMRRTRFACYMRQRVWQHAPLQAQPTLPLTEESSSDQIGIMALMCHTIPTLQQSVAIPTNEGQGLVYRVQQQVEAYIAVTEGRHGVYLLPFIHLDVVPQARDILTSAIAMIPAAARVPVYVGVRSYQSWLDRVIEEMGFTPVAEQAVMVRQIAAGVRHVAFTRGKLNGKLEPAHRVTPPYWSSARPHDED